MFLPYRIIEDPGESWRGICVTVYIGLPVLWWSVRGVTVDWAMQAEHLRR